MVLMVFMSRWSPAAGQQGSSPACVQCWPSSIHLSHLLSSPQSETEQKHYNLTRQHQYLTLVKASADWLILILRPKVVILLAKHWKHYQQWALMVICEYYISVEHETQCLWKIWWEFAVSHERSYLIFLQCDLSHLSVPYKGACHLENPLWCAHFYEVIGREIACLLPHLSLKREWADCEFLLSNV